MNYMIHVLPPNLKVECSESTDKKKEIGDNYQWSAEVVVYKRQIEYLKSVVMQPPIL